MGLTNFKRKKVFKDWFKSHGVAYSVQLLKEKINYEEVSAIFNIGNIIDLTASNRIKLHLV